MEAVARRFAVARSTVYRWVAAVRGEGWRQARRMGRGPALVIGGAVEAPRLRRVTARTVDALHEACGPALAVIAPQDAAGFFRRCGYVRSD